MRHSFRRARTVRAAWSRRGRSPRRTCNRERTALRRRGQPPRSYPSAEGISAARRKFETRTRAFEEDDDVSCSLAAFSHFSDSLSETRQKRRHRKKNGCLGRTEVPIVSDTMWAVLSLSGTSPRPQGRQRRPQHLARLSQSGWDRPSADSFYAKCLDVTA